MPRRHVCRYGKFGGAVHYGYKKMEYSVNAEYFLGSDYSDQVYPGSPINVFATIRYRFQ